MLVTLLLSLFNSVQNEPHSRQVGWRHCGPLFNFAWGDARIPKKPPAPIMRASFEPACKQTPGFAVRKHWRGGMTNGSSFGIINFLQAKILFFESQTPMNSLDYAQKLVAFESTSPLSNVAVTDYVQETLERLGFRIERVDYDDPRGVKKSNVIGKRGEGTGGLAYFGHTDVVPADPWFFDEHGPFDPTIKDDRLYGRGSCDMKGSIACMLAAAEQVAVADQNVPLYITCTADEEVGYGGARQVAERSELFREMVEGATCGIIGEPTLLEVVHAHKGTYGFIATARGRAAHSSTREGINANLAMIPFLAEMKKIHDETETDAQWQNDEFDPPGVSWNIGINDHTKAINITPPQSVCTVYFRPPPGVDAPALLERARTAAEEHGLEFEVRSVADPVYVDPQGPFIQQMLELSGCEKAHTVCYGTDGAMFREMKELVVFGPGAIAQAHTHDDWIALEQLDKGTEMYLKAIRKWCC